ncbi:unnamed protein product, partial [Mesorhabditis spiculigera]
MRTLLLVLLLTVSMAAGTVQLCQQDKDCDDWMNDDAHYCIHGGCMPFYDDGCKTDQICGWMKVCEGYSEGRPGKCGWWTPW